MLIPLDYLIGKYAMDIKGVIHIGAHHYEEKEMYESAGIENISLVEANMNCMKTLRDRTNNFESVEIWMGAAGSKAGDAIMNTEQKNGGQSNSLLEPLLHKEYYPDIIFNGTQKVRVDTLDYIVGNTGGKYNFINCDAQGFELEIFKGATSLLNNDIDYIYCEVNRELLYRDCALVEQIDSFLKEYNFERAETKWTNQGWGDAAYLKIKK